MLPESMRWWGPEAAKKKAEVIRYMLTNPFCKQKEVAAKFWLDIKQLKDIRTHFKNVHKKMEEKREETLMKTYKKVIDDIADITEKQVAKLKEKAEDDLLDTRELKDLSWIAKDNIDRINLMEGRATEQQSITINFN